MKAVEKGLSRQWRIDEYPGFEYFQFQIGYVEICLGYTRIPVGTIGYSVTLTAAVIQ